MTLITAGPAPDGYVEVHNDRYPSHPEIKAYARPDSTCLREMRAIRGQHRFCLMPKGHRGRCSSVVFECDVCGQTRRGEPYISNDEVSACWMCAALPSKGCRG